MHSHHSHSGEYVAHGADTLDGVVSKAIELQFDTFCLTEHMPRSLDGYLYPEEIERDYNFDKLKEIYDNFYQHAYRIQTENRQRGTHTKFLIGTELEGDLHHVIDAISIREKYDLDLIVGSVHFVNHIPIDFNREMFLKAKQSCGDSFYELFKENFILQQNMLSKIKPEIVGHFDLIRLMITEDDIDPKTGKKINEIDIQNDWPEIWDIIVENLKIIKSYGGLIELNSSAIRKGWTTPYPKVDIAKAVIDHCDARFCLSDDSHSITQVGLNYGKVLSYVIDVLKLNELWFLDLQYDGEKKIINPKSISIEDVKNSPFFKNSQ